MAISRYRMARLLFKRWALADWRVISYHWTVAGATKRARREGLTGRLEGNYLIPLGHGRVVKKT